MVDNDQELIKGAIKRSNDESQTSLQGVRAAVIHQAG